MPIELTRHALTCVTGRSTCSKAKSSLSVFSILSWNKYLYLWRENELHSFPVISILWPDTHRAARSRFLSNHYGLICPDNASIGIGESDSKLAIEMRDHGPHVQVRPRLTCKAYIQSLTSFSIRSGDKESCSLPPIDLRYSSSIPAGPPIRSLHSAHI